MAVLTFKEMLDLKELAGEYGYAVHVHDACGGQSFTLEQVRNDPSMQIYGAIKDFFAEYQMTVNFYDGENLNFVAR